MEHWSVGTRSGAEGVGFDLVDSLLGTPGLVPVVLVTIPPALAVLVAALVAIVAALVAILRSRVAILVATPQPRKAILVLLRARLTALRGGGIRIETGDVQERAAVRAQVSLDPSREIELGRVWGRSVGTR